MFPFPPVERPLYLVLEGIRYAGKRNPICLADWPPSAKADWQGNRRNFMEKINTAAAQAQAKTSEHTFKQGQMDVSVQLRQLTDHCRVMERQRLAADGFVVRLQIKREDRWITIAWYEYRSGQAARFVNHADGRCSSFKLNLPYQIIKEMANQDFSRNWQTYALIFQAQKQKTMSIQT